MTPKAERAPAIAEKLEGARAALAAHNEEVAQTVLDAAENVSGAQKRLAELRSRISTAEREVLELEKAHALAARIDRQSAVRAASQMRGEQLTVFEKALAARSKAMGKVLELFGEAAKVYGVYSEATLRAQIAAPSGTVIPVMAIGPNGVYGPAFGPCERLVLAELYRMAPERSDGVGRFVFPFCKPSSEQFRGNPAGIRPGIEELLAADNAIIASIKTQIERLDNQAMRAAGMIPDEQKDVAA